MGAETSVPLPEADPFAARFSSSAAASASTSAAPAAASAGSCGGKAGKRRRPRNGSGSTATLSPPPVSPNSSPDRGGRYSSGRKQLKTSDGLRYGQMVSSSSTEEVEVVAPSRDYACRGGGGGDDDDGCRSLEEEDRRYVERQQQQRLGRSANDPTLQTPRMARPSGTVASAYAGEYSPTPGTGGSATTAPPVCWGWLPRSLSSRSTMPAISVVSDESGGSSASEERGGGPIWEEEEEEGEDGNSTDGVRGSGSSGGEAGARGPSTFGREVVGPEYQEEVRSYPSPGQTTPKSSSTSAWGPPPHPLSGHGAGSFLECSSTTASSALTTPPLRSSPPPPPPPPPLSSSNFSRQDSFGRGHSGQERGFVPDAAAAAAWQTTCLPKSCPLSEGGPSTFPDLTCGVGELAQANWEAFSAGTAGGFGEMAWGRGTEESAPASSGRDVNGAAIHGNCPSAALTAEPVLESHLPSALPQVPESLSGEERMRQREELLDDAARYESSGDYASALKCYERCLTEHHRHAFASVPSREGAADGGQRTDVVVVPPSASVDVADVLHRIGVVHWKAGAYDESVRMLREALAIYRRHLRPSPSDTRTAYDEATGMEVKVNPDADALAAILNSLGRVHLSRGECGSAMRCYQESLALQEDVYVEPFLVASDDAAEAGDDLSTGTGLTFDTGCASKSSMGTAGTSASRKSVKSTKAARKTLSSHPGIARTVIAIGMVHDARGNYAKSIRKYRTGYKAQRRALGPDHVDVAATLNAMGLVQEKVGSHDVAERCYEEALRIYRLRLGDAHVDTAVALNNLGQVHHHRGRYDAAMGCYVDALRIMRSVLGDSHRNVAATLHNVGLVHSAQGKHDRALKIYREVLRAQRAALGDGHVDVAVTLDSIAEAYEGKGRYDRSLKFYSKALRVRRSALGRSHPFVAVTLDRIGRFHVERDGDWDEAARRLGEARELYVRNGAAEDDPRVVAAEEYLERCRRSQVVPKQSMSPRKDSRSEEGLEEEE